MNFLQFFLIFFINSSFFSPIVVTSFGLLPSHAIAILRNEFSVVIEDFPPLNVIWPLSHYHAIILALTSYFISVDRTLRTKILCRLFTCQVYRNSFHCHYVSHFYERITLSMALIREIIAPSNPI